jgi:SAM-dependent methyltransferase
MKKFLSDRLVCPVSKRSLTLNDGDGLLSAPCGFRYRQNDFRVGLEFSKDWVAGQSEYESFERFWLNAVNHPEKLLALDRETFDVYDEIKMVGDVLDVGGAYGFVIKQAGLNPDRYVSLDPIDMDWNRLNKYQHITGHYSACQTAIRVRGFAEFLPFADGTFDFVHMRSCIDHFANPNLALMEAFRVLRPEGRLVVGISLEGSYRKDQVGLKGFVKRMASTSPALRQMMDIVKHDHHMFHPTRDSLSELIKRNGFKIEKEVWQKAYHNVIYLQAERLEQLQVGLTYSDDQVK